MAMISEPQIRKGDAPCSSNSEKEQVCSPCLLDTKEVAAFLNVKESTIRHWVHIGYIPHIKFRGAVRYQRAAIMQWIEECAVSADLRDARKLSGEVLRSRNRRS